MSFGATPVSTTALGSNQFPVSAVAVPNHSGGNLTALEGGPASTDSNGNETAPASIYIKDGGSVALGTTTDASSANTLIGLAKAIKANTASVVIGSGTVTANQGGSWTVTANAGTNLNTSALALDASIQSLLLSQGSSTLLQKGPLQQGAVSTSAPSYTNGQTSPMSLTPAGALRTDGSAVTQPVSGTVSVNSLPAGSNTIGSFKLIDSGGSNVASISAAGALKVDNSAVTQPISGSVTANIGTTNGLALDATTAKLNVAQGAALGSNTGPMIQGSVTTAAPSYTTGNINPLSLTTTGLLRVDGSGATQPISGTVTANAGSGTFTIQSNASTNLNQIAGSAVATAATGIVKVGLTDGSGTALTSTSNALDVNIKSGGGSGFSVVDEAAWTAGSSAFVPAGGVFNDSAVALTSGQQGTARLTNNRAIHANLRDASGNQLLGSKTSANSVSVVIASDQGAIPASQSGTWTVTANAGSGTFNNQQSNVTADYDTGGATQTMTMFGLALPASGGSVAGGTATNPVRVDVTGSTTQPVSGSVTVTQGTASSLNAQVVGSVASGSSNGGNPVKTGGVFNTTQPTVTNGQIVDAQMTNRGAQIVSTGADTFNVTVNAALPAGGNTIGAVTQASGPWTQNLTQVAGSSVSTSATGVQKVGITGNAGATLDSTVAAGTAPTNALVTGVVYNSTAPAPTSGQAMAMQADQSGNARVFPGIALASLSAWNSGTSLNATQNIFTNSGCPAVLVQLDQTTTITAGAITFEATYDGTNWITVPASSVMDPTSSSFAQIALPYTLQASTNKPFIITSIGWQGLRVKLSTQITGSGSVTPFYALLPYDPVDSVVAYSPTASNFNINVGQFGGNNAVTGTGAGGSGIPRVTVSNDTQIQQWDGTRGPVAVKAANTPPTLADLPAVQALSPMNTGLPVNTPAIVQKTNNKSTGSVASLAVAFGSNNVAGNSIIVVCGVGNGTAPTISDTAGNTYTQAAQVANSTTLNVAVFYAVNIASGANTVTVNNGGSTASIVMEIYEVSGLIAQVQAQPDQTATNTGSSGTASTVAISALYPNELAFAAVGIGTAAQTITAGSGWTNDSGQQNPTTPAGLFSFVSMSQFLAVQKFVTPQATFTSEPWAIAVATFKTVALPVVGTVSSVAAPSGGSTPYHLISAASTNGNNIKSAPGQVYGFSISNTNASARFFRLYNLSGSPTVGSSTIAMTVQVPANATVIRAFPTGLAFSTGIAISATGAMGDSDTTAIGAGDLSIDIDYR